VLVICATRSKFAYINRVERDGRVDQLVVVRSRCWLRYVDQGRREQSSAVQEAR
jgi:hypothetical protein